MKVKRDAAVHKLATHKLHVVIDDTVTVVHVDKILVVVGAVGRHFHANETNVFKTVIVALAVDF